MRPQASRGCGDELRDSPHSAIFSGPGDHDGALCGWVVGPDVVVLGRVCDGAKRARGGPVVRHYSRWRGIRCDDWGRGIPGHFLSV